jgi:hypothetical protein
MSLLADLVVTVHLVFVLFVAIGGLLVLRWPRVAWLHLPAAAWGVFIEFVGWICPLTPLEHALRARAGESAYTGAFVDRYLVPLLYPDWLTRPSQVALGLAALAANVVIYSFVIWRAPGRRSP